VGTGQNVFVIGRDSGGEDFHFNVTDYFPNTSINVAFMYIFAECFRDEAMMGNPPKGERLP